MSLNLLSDLLSSLLFSKYEHIKTELVMMWYAVILWEVDVPDILLLSSQVLSSTLKYSFHLFGIAKEIYWHLGSLFCRGKDLTKIGGLSLSG